MATKNFSIAAAPGLTMSLRIRKKSNNYYWTGTAWQEAAATVTMTEVEDLSANYSEYYSTTAPDAPSFWWALDSTSVLWTGPVDYDPTQTTSATTSDIAPDTDDLKEALEVSGDEDDALIVNCANRAGTHVETYCDRRFNSAERTYILDGAYSNRLYLPDWPITVLTSIHGPNYDAPRVYTTEVSSDYYRIGRSGMGSEAQDHIVYLLGPWGQGTEIYQVVATVGYATIPSDLYQATIEVAMHYYNTMKHKRLGLTSQSMEGGTVGHEMERALPKQTRDVLNRYRSGHIF